MLHITGTSLFVSSLLLVGFGCSMPRARAQAIGAGGRLGETVRAVSTPALGWDSGKQGAFVVALASGAGGEVWAGTEDNGVWRYQPHTRQWVQFTTKDGLGDDNGYAIAIDRRGRVWVGHLSHGLSVWNGEFDQIWIYLESPGGPVGLGSHHIKSYLGSAVRTGG